MYSFAVSVINLFSAPFLNKEIPFDTKDTVSVLIPARNEEKNIRSCLESIRSQTYSNLEILVYDDSSEDRTYEIVSEISMNDKRVHALKGIALPENWLGKNHACWMLSKNAAGKYFLFIDSDVILEKDAVASAVSAFRSNDSDLLSVFPKQLIVSNGENAVVPFMNWLLLSFLPVKLVSSDRFKSFAGANGQFILWNKESYESSGGHSAVKSEIVEDIEIARYLKKKGYRIVLLMSSGLVSCRMYNNFKEAVSGFSKNIFPASGMPAFFFIMNVILMVISNLAPFILMFFSGYFLVIALMIILQRMVVSHISSQNMIMNVLLHPVQMLMLLWISIRSVYQTKNRKSVWKGRKI